MLSVTSLHLQVQTECKIIFGRFQLCLGIHTAFQNSLCNSQLASLQKEPFCTLTSYLHELTNHWAAVHISSQISNYKVLFQHSLSHVIVKSTEWFVLQCCHFSIYQSPLSDHTCDLCQNKWTVQTSFIVKATRMHPILHVLREFQVSYVHSRSINFLSLCLNQSEVCDCGQPTIVFHHLEHTEDNTVNARRSEFLDLPGLYGQLSLSPS